MYLPPVGLVDLPRHVGHLQHQQEQVFPHPAGHRRPLLGREFRKGVGQVLIDHLGPHVQHVVHQPAHRPGQLAAGFQRHGLDDADQDADGDVGEVVEDVFSRHGKLLPWTGQMFVVPASADPKTRLPSKSGFSLKSVDCRVLLRKKAIGGRGKSDSRRSRRSECIRPIASEPGRQETSIGELQIILYPWTEVGVDGTPRQQITGSRMNDLWRRIS